LQEFYLAYLTESTEQLQITSQRHGVCN